MFCEHPKRDTEWHLSEVHGDVLSGRCLRCEERLIIYISDYSPSQKQLKDICQRARDEFEESAGNCLEISTYVLSALHDVGVPARINKTKVNGTMHYEVHAIIDGKKILIDASRDQFQSYNEGVYIESV
jgi:hypothetical protein